MKNQTTVSTYEQSAIDFLAVNGLQFKASFIGNKSNFFEDGDNVFRDVYKCELFRSGNHNVVSFNFGQSISKSGAKRAKPTAYDLLTCITKNDPGTFENFCGDFGYDEDSRKAEKVYNAVCKEWEKVERFSTYEELEQVQEIQ